MTSADGHENKTDENKTDRANEDLTPPRTAQELLPRTVTFIPLPDAVTDSQRSPQNPPATHTGTNRSRSRRRITVIGGGIAALVLLSLFVVRMTGDGEGTVTIEAPPDLGDAIRATVVRDGQADDDFVIPPGTTHRRIRSGRMTIKLPVDAQDLFALQMPNELVIRRGEEIQLKLTRKPRDPQVEMSSLQSVGARAAAVAEPPALDEWLNGRTILTVAQDGSGQFKAIQDALNALQPGQVVEVLDAGPYRERLALSSSPADVGLISRVQTRVEFADSELGSMGDLLTGHVLHNLNQFRFHGFEFVIPDNPQAGKRDVACFHIGNSAGVVFENCAVHRTSHHSFLVIANTVKAAVPPHVIRECDLEVIVQSYSFQPESEIMVLRNHLALGLTLHGVFKLCVVRNNIFLESHFGSLVIHADTFDCSNNTFLNRREAIRFHTKEMLIEYERGQRSLRGETGSPSTIDRGRAPTGDGVIFNNLHFCDGFLNVDGGGQHDAWSWEIGYNCFPGDGNIPPENALPRSTNTLAAPMLYSLKPQSPKYARLKPDSPGAKSGAAGGALPRYAGALPPGPAPQEGDWFTRLHSRWMNPPTSKSERSADAPTTTDSLLAFQKPGFDAWLNEFAELPPERLAEQVTRKLVELNPGFDGKVDMPLENGIVRQCKFHTDNVTDVSPLRALRELKVLVATGSRRSGAWDHLTGTGKLSNLSPLQGMSLEHVELRNNPLLEDLSPLAGMPLKALHCEQTDVADLTPLKGMKLEATTWSNTRISNLSVFQGMPLTYLTCEFTDVSDLTPLAGIPLKSLSCGFTKIKDLAPLRGMPLEHLNCDGTGVTDVSALSHSRLKQLICGDTRISDLSPLRSLPLIQIYMPGTPVSDVSPLRTLELESLMLDASKIVRGMGVVRRMRSLKTVGIGWGQMWPKEEFWKKYDAGELGKPVTTAMESDEAGGPEEHIRPYPIQEPPPLQDWLKGRTVVTVAQDGSGQFKTIQDALNAMQSGQVIKVLDKGPYHERLNFDGSRTDIGLISEVQTSIVLPEFTLNPEANLDDGHLISNVNQLRVHGIEFMFPKTNPGRHARAIALWAPHGVVFENCAVRRLGEGSFTCFGGIRGEPDRPNLIRDCYLENTLQAYSSGDKGSVVVLRNYLAGETGLAIEAKFKLCVVRHNIFAPTMRMAFNHGVIDADWFEFSNNTILSFPDTILMDTKTALLTFEKWDRVRKGINEAPQIDWGHAPAGAGAIYNNLHSRTGFLNVTGGGEREPWSWKIGYNVYPGDGPVPAQNAMNQVSNIIATPMFYSIWTKDADFARLNPDSPGATVSAGEGWPGYAGALPPGPAPKEGDWFTRLRERWKK